MIRFVGHLLYNILTKNIVCKNKTKNRLKNLKILFQSWKKSFLKCDFSKLYFFQILTHYDDIGTNL